MGNKTINWLQVNKSRSELSIKNTVENKTETTETIENKIINKHAPHVYSLENYGSAFIKEILDPYLCDDLIFIVIDMMKLIQKFDKSVFDKNPVTILAYGVSKTNTNDFINDFENCDLKRIGELINRWKFVLRPLYRNNIKVEITKIIASDIQNYQYIRELVFNHRHYRMSLYLETDYSNSIPPDIRANVDYIIFNNDHNPVHQRKMYNYFLGCYFENFQEFQKFLTYLPSTIVVDCTKYTELEEIIFYL